MRINDEAKVYTQRPLIQQELYTSVSKLEIVIFLLAKALRAGLSGSVRE